MKKHMEFLPLDMKIVVILFVVSFLLFVSGLFVGYVADTFKEKPFSQSYPQSK